MLNQLNQHFAIPNIVRFDAGNGVLPRIVVTTGDAEGHIYLHGAHVTHYQRRGEQPILWMSGKSMFAAGKPIRGGVPVIFPWFGARQGHPEAPGHGFARLSDWTVESVDRKPDGSVTVTLTFEANEQTRAAWPHEFALRFRATVGKTLGMSLEVQNKGAGPFTFEEALHTYFTVGEIQRASVHGLSGVTYLGKAEGNQRVVQGPQAITFTGETDRVYFNTRGTCTLDDAALGRKISVSKTGSDSTVVWNPWIAKAKAMPDFGDDEWPGMVCIETANAMDNALTLAAGKSHVMTVAIA